MSKIKSYREYVSNPNERNQFTVDSTLDSEYDYYAILNKIHENRNTPDEDELRYDDELMLDCVGEVHKGNRAAKLKEVMELRKSFSEFVNEQSEQPKRRSKKRKNS